MSDLRNRILYVFLGALWMAMPGSPAQANVCENLYDRELTELQAPIISEIKSEIADRVKAQSETDLEGRKKTSRLNKIETVFMNFLTEVFRIVNGHTYPYVQLSEGDPIRWRVLSKIGSLRRESQEWLAKINSTMALYKFYQLGVRREIERVVTLHKEYEIMDQAFQKNEWPATVVLPKATGKTKHTVYKAHTFYSRAQVQREMKALKKRESDKFDTVFRKSFSRKRYFDGKDWEQARLLARLHTMLVELKKFENEAGSEYAFPGKDELIQKIESLVYNPKLHPPDSALLKVAQIAFQEEFKYLKGKNSPAQVPTDVRPYVRERDAYEQGFIGRRVSFIYKTIRVFALATPLILYSTLQPGAYYKVNRVLREGAVKQDIAMSASESDYQKQMEKFLSSKYGLDFKVGKPAFSPEATKDIREIAAERQRFLDLQKNVREAIAAEIGSTEVQSENKLDTLIEVVKAKDSQGFLGAVEGHIFKSYNRTLTLSERASLQTLMTTKELAEGESAFEILQSRFGHQIASELQLLREMRDQYVNDVQQGSDQDLAALQLSADFR
jgi:hypothetical protein